MRHLRRFLAVLTLAVLPLAALAQDEGIEAVLEAQGDLIEESSRRTIEPAISALTESGIPLAREVLRRWQERELYRRMSDGVFFFAEEAGDDTLALTAIATGENAGEAPEDDFAEIRPNAGIRAMIQSALAGFRLQDEDITLRRRAVEAIARSPEPEHLAMLRNVMPTEPDPVLQARMERLERLLTVQFAATDAERVEAIESFGADTAREVRAALTPIVAARRMASVEGPAEGDNVARTLTPGSTDLSAEEAYALLVSRGLAPERIDRAARRDALVANIVDGRVGGVPVAALDTQNARDDAYAALAAEGIVPATALELEIEEIVDAHVFYELYTDPAAEVTTAARDAIDRIAFSLEAQQYIDLGLDALSLASIYFLAAIGLAITFGVMGVINMAHGEFIMLGAFTGWLVQTIVPNYTISLIVALPLAFAVAFGAGVALERVVIRHLYHRPLETLLATFGISIALQQLVKNVFGTQAKPLTPPDWLAGSLVVNDIIGISYLRIGIFGMALVFLGLLLFVLNRTRLGLEVRAVTQNPRMAASMGINPGRINMLTFGLGSGIAGIAGVAIGMFAQVTSEIGQNYIVQSFMTVVIGGVGNIWGTLAGASLIGVLQKGIEDFNPSNTLAAQTYMILFVILFIQFRPKGIVAPKGRAAGN